MEIVYNTVTEDLHLRNQEIRDLLVHGVSEVTFTKVDGTVRTMPCTLRSAAMPVRAVNEHHQTRLYKPETLSAFCLDKNEWRSFRVMNVTDIRIMHEESN